MCSAMFGGLVGKLAQRRLDDGKPLDPSSKLVGFMAKRGIAMPTTPTPGSKGARMAAAAAAPAQPTTVLGSGMAGL